MKIAILSEKTFNGYIPKSFIENLQWDIYLQKVLKAYHISYYCDNFNNINFNYYDIIIAIPPKNNPDLEHIFKKISKETTLIAMQEGSKDHWLNLPIKKQMTFINAMNYCAAILCPNEMDTIFYKGIFKCPVYKFTTFTDTLQIESFGNLEHQKKIPKSMIIGANFDWRGYGLPAVYAGSGIIKNYGIPTMREDIAKDNDLFVKEMLNSNATLYPYVNQSKWLQILNKYQIAIHLSNESATGQFQIQCACLGIPCVGNKELTMQKYLFPDLSIDSWDIQTANTLIKKLIHDKTYYNYVVKKAYKNVSNLDTIVELPNFLKILEKIYKDHNKIHKRILRFMF